MLEHSTLSDTELSIDYLFDAPAARVYQAWVDPEALCRWMGPGEVNCEHAAVDLKVGGRYEIHMQTENGLMVAHGKYIDIVPDEKLVFSWQWRDGTFTDSIVSLQFEDLGEQTRLKLQHSKLPDSEKTNHHNQGWNGCLLKLEAELQH